MSARTLLLAAAATLGALVPAGAQSDGRPAPGDEPQRSAELRERWERKSPEERRLLRERFEALRAMDPAERVRLFDRARRLRTFASRLRRDAPEDERRGLERLAPDEADARWRERAARSWREHGRALRDRLPPRIRRELEAAEPAERRAMLERLREHARERFSRRAVRSLGRALGHSEPEVEAFERLPTDRRVEVALGLARRRIERRVERHGLPPGLDAATWEAASRLDDAAFLDAVRPYLPRPLDARPGAGPPRRRDPADRRPRGSGPRHDAGARRP